MGAEQQNGGNGWRAATAKDIGRLEGEIAAIHRLLSDPETGLSAMHRKLAESRAEISKMRFQHFAGGGALVLFGVLTGQIAPEISKRFLQFADLFQGGIG